MIGLTKGHKRVYLLLSDVLLYPSSTDELCVRTTIRAGRTQPYIADTASSINREFGAFFFSFSIFLALAARQYSGSTR